MANSTNLIVCLFSGMLQLFDAALSRALGGVESFFALILILLHKSQYNHHLYGQSAIDMILSRSFSVLVHVSLYV